MINNAVVAPVGTASPATVGIYWGAGAPNPDGSTIVRAADAANGDTFTVVNTGYYFFYVNYQMAVGQNRQLGWIRNAPSTQPTPTLTYAQTLALDNHGDEVTSSSFWCGPLTAGDVVRSVLYSTTPQDYTGVNANAFGFFYLHQLITIGVSVYAPVTGPHYSLGGGNTCLHVPSTASPDASGLVRVTPPGHCDRWTSTTGGLYSAAWTAASTTPNATFFITINGADTSIQPLPYAVLAQQRTITYGSIVTVVWTGYLNPADYLQLHATVGNTFVQDTVWGATFTLLSGTAFRSIGQGVIPMLGSGGGCTAVTWGAVVVTPDASGVARTIDAVNGDTWLVSQTGVYMITFTYYSSSAEVQIYMTRNAAFDTAENAATNYQLVGEKDAEVGGTGITRFAGQLDAGDVLRMHVSIASASPTNAPSYGYTIAYRQGSSVSPSRSPSAAPSRTPSAAPSKTPTTSQPSRSPSRTPSGAPTTSTPSRSPSRGPSRSPSRNPSRSPSGSPSRSPSREPSRSPSGSPSRGPSRSPSRNPSRSPSGSPSRTPSRTPSRGPSPAPTASPTPAPTDSPTKTPTAQSPTRSPSAAPTASPTKSPTPAPTTGRRFLGAAVVQSSIWVPVAAVVAVGIVGLVRAARADAAEDAAEAQRARRREAHARSVAAATASLLHLA